MEEIDKKTKGYFADFQKEVRKLRRQSGGSGAEQLVTLISAMADCLVGHAQPDDEVRITSLITGLMAVEDAANEMKTAPWLQSFSKLFVHVHSSAVMRVGAGKKDDAVESSRHSTPATSPLPPPKSRGRKRNRSPSPTPEGRNSMQQMERHERETSQGETDHEQGLTPSRLPKRRAKEAANAKIMISRPVNRRALQESANESMEENEEKEESEGREERKIQLIEVNLISPRTKKVNESMEKKVEAGFKTPHHNVKASGDHWPCAGLRGKCSQSFSSHADVYQHMLKEHYLEGVVMGKCGWCKWVAPFAEVIVHRKNGDEFSCGEEDTVMKYWIELEMKKEDETNDETEEREKLTELAVALRKCMHKNCDGPSEKTYEALAEHNRQKHRIRVQFVCMREGCGRTFLHPLAVIRHMKDTCITGYPKIVVKKVKRRKIKEEEKEEEESEEEEEEEDKSDWETMDDDSDYQ